MPEELWTEIRDIVQEAVIKSIPKKNKCKKAKWLSEEALQIAEKREAKGKGEKERYPHLNAGKKHKLESRLPGEISITSDMQMTPPLWQKVKRN